MSDASNKSSKKDRSIDSAGTAGASETAQTPETLIEFPAELSVKAMGLNEPDFVELVSSLVAPHVPGEGAFEISEVKSRHAKYLSIRVHFTADNLEQLHAIYASLRAEPRVLYVL